MKRVDVSRSIFALSFLVPALFAQLQAQVELYFPQAIRGDSHNTTRILVQNPGSLPATATVRFYDQSGQLRETQSTDLQPNGGDEIVLGSVGTPLTVGSAVVTSDKNVLATGFYSLRVAGSDLPPVGLLPVAKAPNWRGFATVSPSVDTGLALANPGSETVHCEIFAYTGSDGQGVGSEEVSLGPGQQSAQFLTEVLTGLPSPYQGGFALQCDRAIAPVALTQRKSDSVIAAVALDSGLGTKEVYFPQAIRGNSENTTRILVQNPGNLTAAVTVRFHDQGGQLRETRDAELQPNGSEEIVLGGDGTPLTVGSVAVLSDRNVLATGFYSLQVGGNALPPVGLLPVAKAASWRGFAAVSPSVDTGLALTNPGSETAHCQLSAFAGLAGQTVGSEEVSLAAGRQSAQFLPEIIADLPASFQGGFSLECDHDIASVALTQRKGDGAISAVALQPGPVLYAYREIALIQGPADGIASLALSPDGGTVAYGAFGQNTITLVNVSTQQEIGALSGHTKPVTALAFSPDGTLLASTGTVNLPPGQDGSVRLWDVATQTEIAAFDTAGTAKLLFSFDGELLIGPSGGNPLQTIVWQGATLDPLYTVTGVFRTGALSPDNSTLASAARNNFLHLVNVSTGAEVMTLSGHTGWVTATAFDPAGRLIASGADDETICLWDAATGNLVRTLTGHASQPDLVRFSPDGRTLASLGSGVRTMHLPGGGISISIGNADRVLRLWDVDTGTLLGEVDVGDDVLSAVSFSFDWQYLATAAGSGNGNIRVFQR